MLLLALLLNASAGGAAPASDAGSSPPGGTTLSLATVPPRQLTRDSLLARPDLEHVTVESPDLGGRRSVAAVRLATLLGPLPPGSASVDVGCADGFVAVLPAAAAAPRTTDQAAVAYLAIETGADPWPRRSEGDAGVGEDIGPFMVVWTAPPTVTVPREQWPYQVVSLAPSAPLAKRYPLLVPRAKGAAARGLEVFAENCLACHSLNGQGPAQVGPDLNLPLSPLEYLGARRLTAYLRDPQSLHAWPNERMPAFPAEVLSASKLDALLAYLLDRQRERQREGQANHLDPTAPAR